MLLELIRTEHGLVPVSDESVKAVKKIALRDSVFVEYKPRRNYKFHKKYFALLQAVIPNQEHFKTIDNLHEAVKYRAGWFETIIPLKGEPFIKTKSIAFYSMDDAEFETFFSSALDVCAELVGDDAVRDIIAFI